MNSKIRLMTRSGIMLALLLVVQFLTRGMSQIVTGSSVNFVLAISVFLCGIKGSIAVALISPFAAFVLGIGPAFFLIVPFVALGNAVYIAMLWFISFKTKIDNKTVKYTVSVIVSSVLKFLTLYFSIVKLVLPMLGLPEQKLETISAMFSFPQLVTALAGGILAVTVYLLLPKNLKIYES